MIAIYIGSDNLVEIRNLKNVATGECITDATCKMTLVDEEATPIPEAIDIPLAPVDGSRGRYAALIPASAVLTSGTKYFIQLTTSSGGLTRTDRIPVRAQYAEGV